MSRHTFRLFLVFAFLIGNIAFCLVSRQAWAQSDGSGSGAPSQSDGQAQGSGSQGQSNDGDLNDAYDPFIDYNEFDSSGQEEADINFFENGRLLTAQFMLGDRTFTGGFHQLYSDNITYGAAFSYFFNLRFALQFSFTTSSHRITVTGGGQTETGNVSFNEFGVDLKYYFNTSDVTKGLADFNPYILVGLSPITRTSTVDGESEFARDNAVGFDGGLGFEIPFDRHNMFIGGEGLFQIANFPDQYTQITMKSGTINTGIYPNGNILTFLGFIGLNF